MSITILGKNYDIKTTNELYLNEKQLSNLPAEIFKLVNLILLNLGYNQLSNLPVEIGKLVNLKELYLTGNQLSNLPAEIGKLVNLQQLYLCCNKLSNLPAEIGELVNLRYLNLYDNKLSNLPAEIGQQSSLCDNARGKLVNLQGLYLGHNKLKSIPIEILNIKEKIFIDETSYEINNLSLDTEILIFSSLTIELTNLPITLKEIWLKKGIDEKYIKKIPFGCEIKYY